MSTIKPKEVEGHREGCDVERDVSGREGSAERPQPLGKQPGSNLNAGYRNLGNESWRGAKDRIKGEWLDALSEATAVMRRILAGEEVKNAAQILRALEVNARHVLGTEVSTIDNPAMLRALATVLFRHGVDSVAAEAIVTDLTKELGLKGA